MNPAVLAALGLATLVGVGIYQTWTGRLSALGPSGQLMVEDVAYPTSDDLTEPRRLLERDKLANLAMVATELTVLIVAGVAAAAVLASGTVAAPYVALTVVAYLVGAYLVGRAVYVRLGFPTPVESIDDADPEDVAASLAERFDEDLGTTFAAIHGAGATARGDDEAVDPVTAALLAGARSGRSRSTLATWAAETGLASEATVERRAGELVESGLVAPGDELAFTSERLRSADPADVAAVVTSVGA